MKFPKQFTLLNRTWKIKMDPYLASGGQLGLMDPITGTITIQKGLDDDMTNSIFWHELIHCSLSTAGYIELSNNEILVEHLGSSIAQCLKTLK